MKANGLLSTIALVLALSAFGLIASCSGNSSSGGADAGGNDGAGAGGASSAVTDRCVKCTSSADCAGKFCNRVASNDLVDLVAHSASDLGGRCAAPADQGSCGCFTGYILGTKLCVGTGCSGTPVTLCDHLSGQEFTGSVSGAGGSGVGGATGGGGGSRGSGAAVAAGTGGAVGAGGAGGARGIAGYPGGPDAGRAADASGVNSSDGGSGGGAADAGDASTSKAVGQSCSGSAECGSGFCVDHVCCESRCDSPCLTCGATPGACMMVIGKDDAPECTGDKTCDDQGACVSKVPTPVRLLTPANGAATGSVWVQRAVRPRFSWTSSARSDHYEVEIDDSCAPEDFQHCAFPSPEVSEELAGTELLPADDLPVSKAAPVGRRYYWHVRACNAGGCSDWSPVRYVDVGRQRSDLNGDGYADLVLPLPSSGNALGEVHILFGGSPADNTPDVVLRGQAVNDGFAEGGAVPVGDVNGDGYADLLVGSTQWFNGPPAYSYLYYGGSPPSWVASASLGPYSIFSVGAAGDLDGDGYADLALGNAASAVYVFRGSAAGPASGAQPDLQLTGTGNFGSALASTDFNGDGFSDLVVRASGNCATQGGAVVFFGGSTLDKMGDLPLVYSGVCGCSSGSVSAGDLDGDGYGDFIVSSPNDLRADVYWGGEVWVRPVTSIRDANHSCVSFAESIAVGDFNGDGAADAFIPNFTPALFLGGSSFDTTADFMFTGKTYYGGFSVGDFNGDGYEDFCALGFSQRDLYLGGANPNGLVDLTIP